MPELPEVETVRQGLVPVLEGRQIAHVTLWRKSLRVPIPENFEAVLKGAKVRSVSRRGKYLLVFLIKGGGFALHLGMSGRVMIYPDGSGFTRSKHDHFCLAMKDGARIVYNDARRFGMVFLISEKQWENTAPFALMGPEPLGNHFNGEALHEKLRSRRTAVKTALLDQRVVAGVGNIYACEALFDAAIDPAKQSALLKKKDCDRLASAIRNVLKKAIAAGGSSLKDYRNTKGDLGYFQHHFSVYDRAGKACPGCRCNPLKTGGIKRIVQTGRSTFYCPRKQT